MKNCFASGLALSCGLVLSLLAGCSLMGSHHAKPKPVVVGPPDNAMCPPAEQMVQAADSDYGRTFLGRIAQRVVYPADALDAGQVGVVQLCARLNRDGQVEDGRIAAGSGYPLLDGAALVALGGLKYEKDNDPLPRNFGGGERHVWISFPVNFAPGPNTAANQQPAAADRPCKDTGSKDGYAGAGQVTLEEWDGFPAQFSDAVRKELSYPPRAFESKVSGTTLLCVSLDRDSRLLGVSISHSSGSPLLDGASLAALGVMQIRSEIPNLPDVVRQGHDTVTFNQEIEWKPVDWKAPEE